MSPLGHSRHLRPPPADETVIASGAWTEVTEEVAPWRSGSMNALAAAHDASVQMIDTSIVRVHQHGACIIRNRKQSMGRSRGGLTSKIHASGSIPMVCRCGSH